MYVYFRLSFLASTSYAYVSDAARIAYDIENRSSRSRKKKLVWMNECMNEIFVLVNENGRRKKKSKKAMAKKAPHTKCNEVYDPNMDSIET